MAFATSATGGRDGDDHGLELRNVYGVTGAAYQLRAMCRGDSARHIGAALPCCDIDPLRGGAYVPAKTATSCGVGAAAPSAAIIALAALSDPAVDAHAVAIAGTGTDTGAALSPAGELCIRGQTLARGYLDDDALTAERFVVGVASEGIPGASARGRMQRRYLTGDIACLDASTKGDGSLVLLGRRDDQVKVAGARVELGEVRTVLQMRARSSRVRQSPLSELALALSVLAPSASDRWHQCAHIHGCIRRSTQPCGASLVDAGLAAAVALPRDGSGAVLVGPLRPRERRAAWPRMHGMR